MNKKTMRKTMLRRVCLAAGWLAMAATASTGADRSYHHGSMCNELARGESGGVHRSEYRWTNLTHNPADPFGARRVLCPVPKADVASQSGAWMNVAVNLNDTDDNDNTLVILHRRNEWGSLLEYHDVQTLANIGTWTLYTYVAWNDASYYLLEASLTPNNTTGYMRMHSYVVTRCANAGSSCF